MVDFGNKIIKLCLEKFHSLPKTGKPSSNQWTVLSAFILEKEQGMVLIYKQLQISYYVVF